MTKPCEQTCSKCGSSDISYGYRAKNERLDSDLLAWDYADRELIRCYCRTCGYKWSVEVLDKALSFVHRQS